MSGPTEEEGHGHTQDMKDTDVLRSPIWPQITKKRQENTSKHTKNTCSSLILAFDDCNLRVYILKFEKSYPKPPEILTDGVQP